MKKSLDINDTNSEMDITSKKFNKHKTFYLLLIILLIVASVSSGYFYNELRKMKQDPNVLAENEARSVIEKVGKLMLLPTDETPTIATVAEPEKIKDQPFFANVKKGDKVLIYKNAKKAILYDPVANKIIEVAPLNIKATPEDALINENS
jgi:hypothetical protein